MTKEEYLKLSNLYKKYFEMYLLSKIDFINYDNLITYSEYDFGNLNIDISLASGLDEFLGCNHFYILNNFYIEKLSEYEINILENENSESINKLIKETYKDIIKYDSKKDSSKTIKINYTNSTSNDAYFDNDCLVIAIYYGSNKNEYHTKENYLKNYSNKKKYLNDLSNRIKNDVNKYLNVKCEVIFKKI